MTERRPAVRAAPPDTRSPAKSMLILVTEWPRVVPPTGEPLTSLWKLLPVAPAAQKSTWVESTTGSDYYRVLLRNLKIFIYMVPVEFPSKQAQFPK